MPKPSSLTLALHENEDAKSSNASTIPSAQRSPIQITGDIGSGSSALGDLQTTSSKSTLQQPPSPSSPRKASSGPVQRKPVGEGAGVGRTISSSPTLTSTSTAKNIQTTMAGTSSLDPLSSRHLHPYRNSPNSSAASQSHGNLLETGSVTSDSIDESAASEQTESETGFKSNSLPRSEADHPLRPSRKPNKHVFQQLVSRSRSIRQDGNGGTGRRAAPKLNTRERFFETSRSRERPAADKPLTAPLEPERGYRDAMDSKVRNRSADRTMAVLDDGHEHPRPATSRFAHLMNSSSKAAGDLGRAGRGFFGKFARSGSHSTEREGPIIDENYQLKVINLPLVEQTRLTRIRQRMSDAKDKTEFWLPSLPYRCIDFLNLKGCEVEGLYRVPGSVREIKHWQMRFDTELDVNLLDEPDLDDVNIIGSILKAWLRDQPDALIPTAVQKRIAEECADAVADGNAPQFLKDELSKLPPFNYYLLFAVTAHLALLQKYSDLNKMDFRNLCICFQPCMNIDPVAFHFLVKDWRNCWQGCWPEKEYLEEEYRVMNGEVASPVMAERPNGTPIISTSPKELHSNPAPAARLPSPDQRPPSRPRRPSDSFGIPELGQSRSPPSSRG